MILKFLKKITAAFAWLQIVVSPTLIGIIIGALIYAFKKDKTGFIIAFSIAITGFIIGIIWAINVWKKVGQLNLCQK